MASITKKPNGSFQIRISTKDENGKFILKSKVFWPSRPNLPKATLDRELKRAVKQFESEVLEKNPALASREPKEPGKMLFKRFCKIYLKEKKSELSPGTWEFYERVIEDHLIPRYGKMHMDEFRIDHVQDFIQYISEKPRNDQNGPGEPVSAATVKRYSTVFRSILSLAHQLGYTEADIKNSGRLVFPEIKKPEAKVFSAEEIDRILEAVLEEPPHLRAVIEVAFFTGCERSEIVGLKWDDIDFENMRISVRKNIVKTHGEKAQEKDCNNREISMPQRLADTLTMYREVQNKRIEKKGERWHDLNYLFTDANGDVMNPQTPTKQFDLFLKRHGIRHLKLQALRHTSEAILLENGCDAKEVSKRLGHYDTRPTRIYSVVASETPKRAEDIFNALFASPPMETEDGAEPEDVIS